MKETRFDLRRLIDDSDMADALDKIFAEVVKVGAVTGSEHRLYQWLIKRIVHDLPEQRPYVKNRLIAKFLGKSQLLISWNGRPEGGKNLLLFAHADHEGYVIEKCERNGSSPNKILMVGSHVGKKKVESWRREGKVRIIYDVNKEQRQIEGIIVSVGSDIDEPPFQVRIEADVGDEQQLEELINTCCGISSTVVAEHVFESSMDKPCSLVDWSEDGKRTLQLRDRIEVPCIDNTAGVAVCTLVLETLAKHNVDVNVSVLYTSGEESGFHGLLSLVNGDDSAFTELLRESICVVVDSSSVDKSVRIGLSEWYKRRMIQSIHDIRIDASKDVRARCPLDVAAIRFEDPWTLYDSGVATMLFQAALGVQQKAGMDLFELEPKWLRHIGVGGEFYGGVCEATILSMYPILRKAWQGEEISMKVRVGSLAIPITNYRNEAGFNHPHMEPEVARTGALYSAALITLNMALNLDNSFPPIYHTGCFRHPEPLWELYKQKGKFEGSVDSIHGHLIDKLRKCLEDGEDTLEHLRGWTMSEGLRLIGS